MKHFKVSLFSETKLILTHYITADGKEQAIAIVMEKLFSRHFNIYMRVEKAIAEPC